MHTSSTCHPAAMPALPSRDSNPFATCWTRPGALPFQFGDGESAKQLIAHLAETRWWGEIVGPHGSGKSTLVEALVPELRAAGCNVQAICLRDGQRWLSREFFNWEGEAPAEPSTQLGSKGASPSRAIRSLIVIDGYEQLARPQRLWLKLRCRWVAAGLVVTSHTPTGLPKLTALAPDVPMIQQLVASLCDRTPTLVTPADVAASHACHGSNVREIFFDLYDCHERQRKSG